MAAQDRNLTDFSQDPTHTAFLNDCIGNVKNSSLEEWINRHFDLIEAALNHYQTHMTGDEYVLQAIRRCRAELIIANRLSEVAT